MLTLFFNILTLTTFSFKTFNILILGSTCEGPQCKGYFSVKKVATELMRKEKNKRKRKES